MTLVTKSTVPPDATERTVSVFSAGDAGSQRKTECIVNDRVIALRDYQEGRLWREQPVDSAGRLHGVLLEWHDNGQLELAEPYHEGLVHGTAYQWSSDGTLLGTYALEYGSGYDIWREQREDGSIYISEIHPFRHGILHGFQWWFDECQLLVLERPFYMGALHGVERRWNEHGRLSDSFPRYWIRNQRVDKRLYVRSTRSDSTLSPFMEEDNQQKRVFPADIRILLES